MKKFIISLALILAPTIAAAEFTTITGDDNLMHITTITDRGITDGAQSTGSEAGTSNATIPARCT